MRKVKVITDSCADLDVELLKKYNIDYAKMSVVRNGKESLAYLTWDSCNAKELYDAMRGGERITTAQVAVEEFNDIFRKYLDKGMDVVYIGCSLKQSGSVNTGRLTAQKILVEYPEAKISCIDSLNASIGEGMLAIEAAKMAEKGCTADEITGQIMKIRKNVLEFATVHTLEHLRNAGRVTASSAFFGNLMGIKPILVADSVGAQAAFKKVKGRKKSFEEIVELLKSEILDAKEQTVYVRHADCSAEEIELLVSLIKENIDCKAVNVGYIGPIIGASVGPDAIGVWALGKTVTFRADAK